MRSVSLADQSDEPTEAHSRSGADADKKVGRWLLRVLVLIIIGQLAALATHIWSAAVQHQWAFLVLGTLAYPVGVIHGMGVWFGCWR